MRPKAGAATACLLLDLTEDRADALGQQIYQVSSGQGTHPGVRVAEQHGERRPATADRIQRFDDGVRETHKPWSLRPLCPEIRHEACPPVWRQIQSRG